MAECIVIDEKGHKFTSALLYSALLCSVLLCSVLFCSAQFALPDSGSDNVEKKLIRGFRTFWRFLNLNSNLFDDFVSRKDHYCEQLNRNGTLTFDFPLLIR
jgi:hypothetical protein